MKTKSKILLPSLLFLIYLSSVRLAAQSLPAPVFFGSWATNIASLTQVTFSTADFNSDSKIDLLLHGITKQSITAQRSLVLTNRGDGGFGRMASLPGSTASFAPGDWSNDGRIDLLRWAGGSSAIMLQTNSGFVDFFNLTPAQVGTPTGFRESERKKFKWV